MILEESDLLLLQFCAMQKATWKESLDKDFEAKLTEALKRFSTFWKEPLGKDFEAIYWDNRWSLYHNE